MKRYEMVPEHMQSALQVWVEDGLPHPEMMGSFLLAVLSNQLVEAFVRADDENKLNMNNWALTLHCDVPRMAWGSFDRLLAWHAMGGMSGIRDVSVDRE